MRRLGGPREVLPEDVPATAAAARVADLVCIALGTSSRLSKSRGDFAKSKFGPGGPLTYPAAVLIKPGGVFGRTSPDVGGFFLMVLEEPGFNAGAFGSCPEPDIVARRFDIGLGPMMEGLRLSLEVPGLVPAADEALVTGAVKDKRQEGRQE